ncbi:MAG: NAD-dependent epimerase/dehydratase family protein [Rhodoferax sp.]|uniref:NAD-dependent epimerase/dehydratase family protein n=1 Tax=Rhodoferax sp. TaxID=50421 RepID=UPI0026311EBE|nr:NAD-dependent epimerase/dehydratase family protein [Rhodoferax sp.]MDD2881593.1 NAD-dependent epimerase/dehydratase family protein [Rhodoferax sp.]
MKILLTGASGFLGSALARHWLNAGHQVALLLRPTSTLDRLLGLDASFDVGRCTTDAEIDGYVKKIQPDAVVHTACAYGRQGETSLQIFDANLRLGLVILQALQHSAQPVSFINTGSALAPEVSSYALSKHQFSQWGCTLACQSGNPFRFVNVLLQHMYGPGDDASKFTTHVLQACRRNDPVLKLTAGEQSRDFIYIDDVVRAYDTLLAQRHQLESAVNIEVGSGIAPTIRQFVEAAHRLTASQTQLLFGALPYRANETMHCVANIDHITQLGWHPAFDLNAGLKKTIELEFNK